MRDDFLSGTKQRLAERVAWHCSMCGTTTVGPGSAPDAKVSIGVAAHICAASSGGPRYNEAMTEAERKDISNGIWLCSNCSQLIDKDPDAFSVETLQQLKNTAEEKARLDIEKNGLNRQKRTTLIQFGFKIIAEAAWISITQENIWRFSVHRFIYGNDNDLYDYCAGFSQLCAEEKFVAIEVQGDGRQLRAAPSILYDQGILEIFVHDKFTATDPDKAGRDLALGEDGDLFVRNGDIAMVEGLDCAKQNLRTALSFQRGEWFLDEKLGSVFGKYFCDFMHEETLLVRLLKLEVSRLSGVISEDGEPYLPMIKRIHDVVVVEKIPEKNRVVLAICVEWGDGQVTTDNYNIFVPQDKAQYEYFLDKKPNLF